MNRKIIAQATLMVMSSIFLSFGRIYVLLLLWKMRKTENVMLYFLQKRNYRRSKEKLRKISIVKREVASIFVVGMMVSGEIYDKAF